MRLDLKLTGCRAITMDPARPAAHTIGIWEGRVAGLDEQVADLPATETVDLGNAVVLPGFIDAHTHLAWNGRRTIDVTGLPTVAQVLDRPPALPARAGSRRPATTAGSWTSRSPPPTSTGSAAAGRCTSRTCPGTRAS